MTEGKRTALYEEHVEAGAKLVPFGGFVMPIEYTGIMAEHRAVRSHVGLFDLSHMGEFVIRGDNALDAVDALMTNEISNLNVWQARYTPMCLEHGGIVDDLLVYRYPDRLVLVVNAANIDKDFRWIRQHLASSLELENVSDDIALIAVQGPSAAGIVQSLTETPIAEIVYYHFREGIVAGIACTISRTGYTGEDGVELYVSSEQAPGLWRALKAAGDGESLPLIGLGARDTLRLEAGLALYGNDIDETTSPLEGGLGWTVKLDNRDFIGAAALRKQKAEGVDRRSVAFEMLDRSIPRPHCAVVTNEATTGEVTSGTFSPTFSKGLGLAYVPIESAKAGSQISVDIRGSAHPAEVVKRPIYKRN